MKIPIGAFLGAAAAPLTRTVLASLGMGIISFAAVTAALGAALTYAQSAYTGLPAYIFALAGLSGMGEAFGMIAGAMIFRVAFTSLPKLGVLPK